MFGLFGKKSNKQDRATARANYERAVNLTDHDARETRAIRIRVGLRCKVVLDKVFRDASIKSEKYAEEVMVAMAGGEPTPKPPTANEDMCYQPVNTVNGSVTGYVPLVYVARMFELGIRHQKNEIDDNMAINLAQIIANEIGDDLKMDLYLVQPITPLEFLTDPDKFDQMLDDEKADKDE